MIILFCFAGGCFASLICCYLDNAHQLPRFLFGRSRCDTCGHVLTFGDLIPVLSYLASRGRCRYCSHLLSIKYLLTELAVAILWGCFQLSSSFSFATFIFLILLSLGTLTDIRNYTMSDYLQCGLLGLTFLINGYSVNYPLACIVIVFLLGLSLRYANAFGGADIKLLAILALSLSSYQFVWLLFISSFAGLLTCWIFGIRRLPFVPFISTGYYLVTYFFV